MSQRRDSPRPDRLQNLSDSDDGLSNPSEDELFLEQEDPQAASQGSRSVWERFTSLFTRDPHAPKSIPLSSRQTRRQKRRARRAARRAKRRGLKFDNESSVMYQADGSTGSFHDDDSDDANREWSDNGSWQEKTPQPRRKCQYSMCSVFLISTFACLLSVAVVFGILQYIRSRREASNGSLSTAKPARLFSNGTSIFAPTTIFISLDGFRADFLDRGLTPALTSFIKNGVSPEYMLPSFPSVTFPNHWTLATGLYPESHGVVGNSFWDEDLQEEFFYTDRARSMFPKWWDSTGAEPLWATAEKQGVRTAVHMWPGSEAGLKPPPTYLDSFNGDEPLANKIRSVLSWLDLAGPFDKNKGSKGGEGDTSDKPRPQLITMYVPNVDKDGHTYGPNSTEIDSTIATVDAMVNDLLSGLAARNLTNIVNVIIVSDHGMASTSRQRLVQFEDLVDPQDIAHVNGWPLYGLRPKKGVEVEQLHSKLKTKLATSGDNPGWSVYTKETMPERWHFTRNPRIAPLFLVPDAGWSIVTKKEMDLSDPSNENAVYHPKGIHGYDNESPLMRAIFVARGPAFPHPPGSRLEPFQNIEVYNIVCQSLGIIPRASNATLTLPLSPKGFHGDQKGSTNTQTSQSSVSMEPSSETKSPDADQPGSEAPEEDPQPEEGEKPPGELEKVKGKLNNLWDSFRQGFGKLKDWLSDKFGAKKVNNESNP